MSHTVPAPSRAAAPHRPARRPRALPVLLLAGLAVVAGACGKRGAPLAPLPRVPAAVQTFTANRRADVVELTLVVPSANVGGDQPGDIAAIEVYAITAERAPVLEAGQVPMGFTLVTSLPVRRPLLPAPPAAAGVAPLPPPPGLDQGGRATVREELTAAQLRDQSPPPVTAVVVPDAAALSLPLVFARPGEHLRRHYAAVAVSRRGRRSAWSTVRAVPIASGSGAPSAPALTFDAAAYALTWTPAPDARLAPAAAADGRLESRPFGPAVTATRYNVYDAPPAGAGTAPTPAPLNKEPLPAAAFSVSGVTFDQARCFVVRAVDTFDAVDVEGPVSAPGCVTARDTFAPPAPTALEAVGSAGVISLIWEGVDAPDLAGYLVFRGTAGSEPTTLLTPAPVAASSFEDRTVIPGTRYVYVVVAVDSATPGNRSGPSNRAEETARQ